MAEVIRGAKNNSTFLHNRKDSLIVHEWLAYCKQGSTRRKRCISGLLPYIPPSHAISLVSNYTKPPKDIDRHSPIPYPPIPIPPYGPIIPIPIPGIIPIPPIPIPYGPIIPIPPIPPIPYIPPIPVDAKSI